MTSLLWSLMFGILLAQMIVIILLCMPLPFSILKGVDKFNRIWAQSQKIRTFIRCVVFIIFVFFVDSLRAVMVYTERHEEGNFLAHNDLMNQIQRFRSQRNAYITGFILFFCGVLWRLLVLIGKLYQCEQENLSPLDKKKVE